MATHYSLDALGIGPGDIETRIGALDDVNPPPGQPLRDLSAHLGTAPQMAAPAPVPQQNWDSIFKPGGMG